MKKDKTSKQTDNPFNRGYTPVGKLDTNNPPKGGSGIKSPQQMNRKK